MTFLRSLDVHESGEKGFPKVTVTVCIMSIIQDVASLLIPCKRVSQTHVHLPLTMIASFHASYMLYGRASNYQLQTKKAYYRRWCGGENKIMTWFWWSIAFRRDQVRQKALNVRKQGMKMLYTVYFLQHNHLGWCSDLVCSFSSLSSE